jgi:hypothetical protein
MQPLSIAILCLSLVSSSIASSTPPLFKRADCHLWDVKSGAWTVNSTSLYPRDEGRARIWSGTHYQFNKETKGYDTYNLRYEITTQGSHVMHSQSIPLTAYFQKFRYKVVTSTEGSPFNYISLANGAECSGRILFHMRDVKSVNVHYGLHG